MTSRATDTFGERPARRIANMLKRYSVPRAYAGDYDYDFAERIIEDLEKGGYAIRANGPGRLPETEPVADSIEEEALTIPAATKAYRHIATRHHGNGEVTLCGQWINYANWAGWVTAMRDAPPCPECERLDA